MIETEAPPLGDLGVLSSDDLAARIVTVHNEQLVRETTMLQLACAWADVHDIDSTDPHYQPLIERACFFGGEGTPEVAEHCVAEFAALQGKGIVAGRLMMADALDLRHRLPKVWELVLAGAVPAWSAQRVAQETRKLSYEACRDVDPSLAALLPTVPWPRYQAIMRAAVLEADPAQAKARAERARTQRDVWVTETDDGLKLLLARAASGDVTWFLATVNRIADILAVQGDTDPVGARRAKAIGILAQPALALHLLTEHRDDPDPGPSDSPADDGVMDADLDLDVSPSPEPAPEDAPPDPADERPNEEAFTAARSDCPSTGSGNVDSDGPSTSSGNADGGSANVGIEPPVGDKTSPEPVEGPSEPPSSRSLDLGAKAFTQQDLAAARPRVVLYFHLSDATLRDGLGGNVRPEHGAVLTLEQLHAFLADTGCHVIVKPVIDPAAVAPVDAYEIPTRVREAARLRQIADVFPYGTNLSRAMDLDHTIPYKTMTDGGPPGQTKLANLGPHSRSAHRTKTHSSWSERQPDPGTYLHRTPTGYIFVVTNQGTLSLGKTPYAHAVWDAATPQGASV